MFLSNRGSFRPETSGAYTLRRRGRRRPKSGSAIGACAVARLAGSGGPIGDYYGSANKLSDYVRSESKTQAGPDGRIAKAARLVADFLESPPESPSAADLSLLREMALMTAPYAEAGAGARKVRRRASHSKSSK